MIETMRFALKALMGSWRTRPEPTMADIDRQAERSHRRLEATLSRWKTREWRLDGEVLVDCLESHIEQLQAELDAYDGDDDTARAEAETELRAAMLALQLWCLHREHLGEVVRQLDEVARGRIAREIEGRFPGSEIAGDLRGE